MRCNILNTVLPCRQAGGDYAQHDALEYVLCYRKVERVQRAAELNLIDGLWVNLYGGLQNISPGGKTAFTTNFDFKLTLPEKFKLF